MKSVSSSYINPTILPFEANNRLFLCAVDIAKHRLELKDQKLKAVVEKLSKEKKRAKHSKGDIAKVVNAHRDSGRLKIGKFVKKDD